MILSLAVSGYHRRLEDIAAERRQILKKNIKNKCLSSIKKPIFIHLVSVSLEVVRLNKS